MIQISQPVSAIDIRNNFKSDSIGFFYLDFEKKNIKKTDIVYMNHYIYFRNIYIFYDYLKDIAVIQNKNIIKINIFQLL